MPPAGFDDDFFEERFRPAKPVFDEKILLELEQGETFTKHVPELRHLKFAPGLADETVHELKRLVQALLEFSDLRGFQLRDANHQVFFTDISGYEKGNGTRLPDKIPLPASRLDYHPVSKVYTVTVILPPSLASTEVRINLTRTLFSKLFGEIHFQEKIFPLEFYQQSFKTNTDVSAGIPEILELLATLEFPSERFSTCCEDEATRQRLSFKKDRERIIRDLTQDWKRKWEEQSLGSTEIRLLNSIHAEFRKALIENPQSIYQQVLTQVRQFDAQLHLILPHDDPGYRRFEEENPLQFLRSYANRLEEVLSLIGFIEEVQLQIKETKEKEALRSLHAALTIRMSDLHRDGKARPYLIPELEQTDSMKDRSARFPLKMLKWLPEGTPLESWNSELKKMEKHFAQSFYVKLYLALDALNQGIRAKLEGTAVPDAKKAEQRLSSLIYVFRFRSIQLRQWRNTLGILVDAGEVLPRYEKQTGFSMNMLLKAWAYMLSTLLTLEFYQSLTYREFVPDGFQPEQYMSSIHDFIQGQAGKEINFYHLVMLFLLVYEKKSENAIEFLHFCLRNPLMTLRYVLERTLAPLAKGDSLQKRLEQLPLHRDTLLEAYGKRWLQYIAEDA